MSEILTIAHDNVSATINSYGGSPDGIVVNDEQVLWQNDGRWPDWKRKPGYPNQPAPILFPACGPLQVGKDGKTGYMYDGEFFPMKQHGFARISDFKVWAQGADYCHLVLTSDAKTKKAYPFDFTFGALYSIVEDGVSITYSITNTGELPMLYNIGDHPAFAIDKTVNHYSLSFDNDEDSEITLTNEGSDRKLFYGNGDVFLQPHWLSDDKTVKITGINNGKCQLLEDGVPKLVYDIGNDNFWLWSGGLPTPEVPGFLCIEPLYGDAFLFNNMKENVDNGQIMILEPGKQKNIKRDMIFPNRGNSKI